MIIACLGSLLQMIDTRMMHDDRSRGLQLVVVVVVMSAVIVESAPAPRPVAEADILPPDPPLPGETDGNL